MGIFDGIGDVAHNLSHGLFGDEEHKRIPAPKGGGLGPRLPMFSPSALSPGKDYPQQSRPMPPKTDARLKAIWEQEFGGVRPYFRVAPKPVPGAYAYTVYAKHGKGLSPVIVFDPGQARDLMKNPRSGSAQFALATALHEMAHTRQSYKTYTAHKQEPAAEGYSQLEYPGVSQDIEGYAPGASDRSTMWQKRAYRGMLDKMMRSFVKGGYTGYYNDAAWKKRPDYLKAAAFLRLQQFGVDPAKAKQYGLPTRGPRAYSMNTQGPTPYFSQAPKTPWGLLKFQPGGY